MSQTAEVTKIELGTSHLPEKIITGQEGFCWTKFGMEAGEPIDQIIRRKEAERTANQGKFLWGIGNSISTSLIQLLQHTENPWLLFSPIRSKPKPVDVAPISVTLWTGGIDLQGNKVDLPEYSLITSKGISGKKSRRHYALVCKSSKYLTLSHHGILDFSKLRNFVTRNKLGFSQVTSVVSIGGNTSNRKLDYEVLMAVQLEYPYFVELTDPITLLKSKSKYLKRDIQVAAQNIRAWKEFLSNIAV